MRAATILAYCALAIPLTGCVPSTDVSGWEIAPKRSGDARMESFPEIPVILPGSAKPPQAGNESSAIHGVNLKRLDHGSLFRRGYSAPTP